MPACSPEIAERQDHFVEIFDYIVRNKIRSAFLMTKPSPYLQQTQGVVISTGSEAGEVGEPTATPYGGSKAILHAFMRGQPQGVLLWLAGRLCSCIYGRHRARAVARVSAIRNGNDGDGACDRR